MAYDLETLSENPSRGISFDGTPHDSAELSGNALTKVVSWANEQIS